jgi:type I restriction enzyme M protein
VTSSDTTVYDPTCGLGSLLLKVASHARSRVSLYGQEKDPALVAIARMNMVLHNQHAVIVQGNTLSNPIFGTEWELARFDYVVSNPPFCDKHWSRGFDAQNDPYGRFRHVAPPPKRQDDFAYLMHVVHSLKDTGTGACVVPNGVLFRGGREAETRGGLVRRGEIRGVIGLPSNLLYGTGVPSCIIVIDKAEASHRKGIFFLDASAGFQIEGRKNRLRQLDVQRIAHAFRERLEVPGYSRMIDVQEIETNNCNLNTANYVNCKAA